MMTCVYDNPASMMRECWQDGELIYAYSFNFLLENGPRIPANLFFFGANIGHWSAGQIVGEKEAMYISTTLPANSPTQRSEP